MNVFRCVVLASAICLLSAASTEAQELPWVVDGTVGYAGFVDDSTKNFFVFGGAVRKQVTPRISIGPEFVVMEGGDSLTDRVVMLTGNVMFDIYPMHGRDARTVTPFLVGGVGGFWSRDQVGTGPFWASDPAFTAGGGVRARVAERVSVSGEYRIGWELHQRVTGSVSFDF
jgi:opacity protein-like surface antigen